MTIIRRIAAVSLLALALLTAHATTAEAATCQSNSICFFDNTNGTGLLEQVSATIRPRSVCYTVASTANNRTSYIVNTAGAWLVFDNATCSSTPGTIYANSQGPMSGQFNNTITSYYRA